MDYITIILNRISKLIISMLRDQNGVHSETAIASLSAVIGKQLAHDVLSESEKLDMKINSKLLLEKHGSAVIQYLINSPIGRGIKTEKIFDKISRDHEPHPNKDDLVDRLREAIIKILEKNDIPQNQYRNFMLLSLINLLQLTAQALDSQTSFNIAIQQIVKVSNDSLALM